jgi:hypothetical protein
MPRITNFAMPPFSRDADGDFIAEVAIEVRSAKQAKATASHMAAAERGAIAFPKTGDPQLGEWDDAIILGRYGGVPDDLAPYTSS